MKMMNKLFSMALCLVAVSCASLGKYKPVEDVSPTLYGDVALSDSESNLANFTWQEVFSDPKLQSLIEKALEGNLNLQASYERICQSEAKLLGAKLAYTPTLGIAADFSPTFYGSQLESTKHSYELVATSSWQLSIFRLINNQRFAEASVEQMKDYSQAVRSRLIASVANTYYTLAMLDSQLLTSQDMESAWTESVETVKALKEAGLADQVAVAQYEANLDNIKITVETLRAQIKQTENAMAVLLGCEVGTKIERGSLATQKIPELLAPGVPVQMLALRPDVRAAERDMELAYYTTRGALLNFFPSLTINGSFGLMNPLDGSLSPMTLLANVGAGLVAPIFNAGKNRSALLAAQSAQRETGLTFQNALLEAGQEVNDAYIDYNSSEEMMKYYVSRAISLDKARQDTEYLMRNSLDKTYLDVLYAYTNFFDAKLMVIANQAKKMQAVVSIYSALGGGAIN